MKRNNRITVRLSDSELEQLNKQAAGVGVSQAGAVRQLISDNNLTEKVAKLSADNKKMTAEFSAFKVELAALTKWLKE